MNYCKLPKHMRRKWGRAIRRGQIFEGDSHRPTRKGFMMFQHPITKMMLSWWRGSNTHKKFLGKDN